MLNCFCRLRNVFSLPGANFDYSEEETFTDYEKIQNVADNDSLGQIAVKYNTKSGNSLSPI